MNRKLTQWIFVGIFIAGISIPGLQSIITHNLDLSSAEKRVLNQLPTWPESLKQAQEYPEQFDAYFQDNFGFRNNLLAVYYELKYWLKDATGSEVIYGSEPGWLFYNNPASDPIGDYRNINQFSAKNLALFIKYLKLKQDWLAAQNITYIFVLTPSKPYIYPEYLPKHLTPVAQENVKHQLATALALHPEINYLDLTDAMLKHKEEQLLYLKADTHWNYYAGNLAQFEIITLIEKIMHVGFEPAIYDSSNFKLLWNHQGDLASLLYVGKHFTEPLLKPDFEQCTEINYMLTLSAESQYATECAKGKLNVLVFHDSFFNLLQQFMSAYFNKTSYIKKRFTFDLATTAINHSKPDLVIEQYTDRLLPILYKP